MKLGVIADDFTGASDIALTLAEGGMRVTQFIGTPEAPAGDIDAGVIALKSRTAPVDEAVDASARAYEWLCAQGARQIIFKVCSTFDSTDEGNIGPVLDMLVDRTGAEAVPVTPAFPENGRSVYQGHLFVEDRLLNESGLENHPLTPMTDPDLRRVLGRQSKHAVGHIDIINVRRGLDHLRRLLATPGPTCRIVDAIVDEDLVTLGRAALGFPLLCGGSGIALGLPSNFGLVPKTPDWTGAPGPGVVISGSCSNATRRQVAEYKDASPSREVTAEEAVSGAVMATDLVPWVMAQDGAPMIFSSADPDVVKSAQETFGRDVAASAIETLFAETAAGLAEAGVKRFVVAGGETSGAVVSGLRATALRIGPRLAPGVPATKVEDDRGLALALKSGNFGGEDFFSTALAMMEGKA
ncbi:MAG: 3-oxo-tetronate kinase [Pseudomonadota bacterium]